MRFVIYFVEILLTLFCVELEKEYIGSSSVEMLNVGFAKREMPDVVLDQGVKHRIRVFLLGFRRKLRLAPPLQERSSIGAVIGRVPNEDLFEVDDGIVMDEDSEDRDHVSEMLKNLPQD